MPILWKWIYLHNAFKMQIRRVSAIKISQIVCMFMKQEIFYAGVNQMKDKTRIALMVGASDSGGGCHFLWLGNRKIHNASNWWTAKGLPFHLKKQANAWFDQKITLWWIINVFRPYQLCTEGNMNAMPLLDNYSSHTMSDEEKPKLPKRLFHFISATLCD